MCREWNEVASPVESQVDPLRDHLLSLVVIPGFDLEVLLILNYAAPYNTYMPETRTKKIISCIDVQI